MKVSEFAKRYAKENVGSSPLITLEKIMSLYSSLVLPNKQEKKQLFENMFVFDGKMVTGLNGALVQLIHDYVEIIKEEKKEEKDDPRLAAPKEEKEQPRLAAFKSIFFAPNPDSFVSLDDEYDVPNSSVDSSYESCGM